MSAATAGRLLQAHRYTPPRGVSTTRAGPLLKEQIPIRPYTQWDEAKLGFLEVDLVTHCGGRLQGGCLSTITLTDVATGWTECLPWIYDTAKTPLQRVLLSEVLSLSHQQELRTIGKAFEPLRLFQQVEQLQQAIFRCEAGRSSADQSMPIPKLLPFDLADVRRSWSCRKRG